MDGVFAPALRTGGVRRLCEGCNVWVSFCPRSEDEIKLLKADNVLYVVRPHLLPGGAVTRKAFLPQGEAGELCMTELFLRTELIC